MATYSINNGEITISFSSFPSIETRTLMKSHHMVWDPVRRLWVGNYTKEIEEVVRQIAVKDPMAVAQPSAVNNDTTNVNVAHDDLDQLVAKSMDDNGADAELKRAVFERMKSDPDSVIELINGYKDEAKAIESEKAAFENAKLALKEIQDRKKHVAGKESVLEQMVAIFMKDQMLDKHKCKDYSVVLTTDRAYSLSDEFLAELIASFNLPAWLNVDVKINKVVLDAMENVPEGVNVTETPKIKLQKNLNDSSLESLELFRKGRTIQEISEWRCLSWITVYSHLVSAMSKGELVLSDYITDDLLEAIKTYHRDNPNAGGLQDYVNAFGGMVKYDVMALALKYLKIK